jgi:aryl-alcohol dehydrogenase-like predicted oxidoreductase
VEALKAVFPNHQNLAQVALKWILGFEEVSCIIPGASRSEQVISNLGSSELLDLTSEQKAAVNRIYEQYIKEECSPDLVKYSKFPYLRN